MTSPSAAPRARDVWVGSALVIVPVALGLFALARFALEGADVPGDDTYAAAHQSMLQAGFDDDSDVVTILPPWSLRPLVHLKARPWISGDDLARRPLHRYRRLWVLVEPDGEADLDAVRARLGPGEVLFDQGGVSVHRFAVAGPAVTYDLRARLDEAEVAIEPRKGAPEPCTLSKRKGLAPRFKCGKKSWQRVQAEHVLVTENGQRAIWVHPPRSSEKLALRWPAVPMGSALVLRNGHLRAGATGASAPVVVEVAVGDEVIATIRREPAFDFRADVIDTARFAGQTRPLTVRVSTRNPGRQHFAIDGYVLGAAP